MDINIKPIAFVTNEIESKKDLSWGEEISTIKLEKQYYGGLNGLEEFTHAIIIYYLNKADFHLSTHLKRRPQNREDMPLVGIFSQRGKDRPNQIGITAVQIISVSEDKLIVKGLDAINETPILDIKPYYPMYDQKDDSEVPEWVYRLMEHYFL